MGQLSVDRQRTLANGAPLVLDDPSAGWIVESGSLLVFAATVTDDAPHGARRYLFTATAGDPLFGLSDSGAQGRRALLAVAVGDAVVRELSLEAVASPPDGGDLPALVGRWIVSCARFSPKASADTAALGVQSALSIEPANPGRSDTAETLLQFQRGLVSALDELDAAEARENLRRLQQKRMLEVEATERALDNLVAAARQRSDAFVPERGTPLFAAAQAAARVLRVQLQAGGDATSVSPHEELQRIARASRIRIRRVTLGDGWWTRDVGPLVALTTDDQPVALLPRRAGYELFDPATHTHTPMNAAARTRLGGAAYMLYQPLPDRLSRPVDVLRFALRGHALDLTLAAATAAAASLLGMLTPMATGVIVDNAIPDADRSLVLQIALGLGAAVFGRAMFELSQGFALLRVETRSTATVQAALWDRLLKLGPTFFRGYTTGDLHMRASAISEARDKLSALTVRSVFLGMTGLLNVALMLYYSPELALLAIAIVAVLVVLTTTCGTFAYRAINELHAISGRIVGLTVQLINGVAKLRVAGAERLAFATWADQYRDQQTLTVKVQQLSDTLTALNQVLPALATALIFWFAAGAFQSGSSGVAVGVGVFLAFMSAFNMFLGGASAVSTSLIEVLDVSNIWTRAKPILEEPLEVDSRKTRPGILDGAIMLQNVSFRYRDDGPPVVDDLTLRIDRGAFVALVGPTGSGKSTVLRILLGFERPRSGAVYYDGQDLSGLDVHAVRRQLGVVLQNSNLLAGSILENIASGGVLSLDQAWAAARRAALDRDIEQMPMGMHTFVAEGGTNLSVGQRQRLLIARALASNPRVILFDEATSALDNRTQAIVQESLEGLHVTRIVVAHRLSTIRKADRIFVIERGRIVQEGTFSQLAAEDGLFSRMMARQMV